jgi:hypothetical protein
MVVVWVMATRIQPVQVGVSEKATFWKMALAN